MFSWRADELIEPPATELLTKDGDRQDISVHAGKRGLPGYRGSWPLAKVVIALNW